MGLLWVVDGWGCSSAHGVAPPVAVVPLVDVTMPGLDRPSLGDGRPVDALEAVPWPSAWHLPLPRTVVSSAFGPRWGRVHEGVDLVAPEGTVVQAVRGGRVQRASEAGSLGLSVELLHEEGWSSRYGHLSAIQVAPGDRVAAGEALGRVGATGRATGPHLHLEVRQDEVPVDPLPLFAPQGRDVLGKVQP